MEQNMCCFYPFPFGFILLDGIVSLHYSYQTNSAHWYSGYQGETNLFSCLNGLKEATIAFCSIDKRFAFDQKQKLWVFSFIKYISQRRCKNSIVNFTIQCLFRDISGYKFAILTFTFILAWDITGITTISDFSCRWCNWDRGFTNWW